MKPPPRRISVVAVAPAVFTIGSTLVGSFMTPLPAAMAAMTEAFVAVPSPSQRSLRFSERPSCVRIPADPKQRIPGQRGRERGELPTSFMSLSPTSEGGGEESKKEKDDEEKEGTKAKAKKPSSRLAMLASDWLEEEEDELASYWDRFDEARTSGTKASTTTASSTTATTGSSEDDEKVLTTEQRLDRYHASRGVDRRAEEANRPAIEAALAKARGDGDDASSTASEAVRALEDVLPYLQPKTRLGGTALLELAWALIERSEEEERDGREGGGEWEDRRRSAEEESRTICRTLLDNPSADVRRGAAEVLRNGGKSSARMRRRGGRDSTWRGFLDPSSWWN